MRYIGTFWYIRGLSEINVNLGIREVAFYGSGFGNPSVSIWQLAAVCKVEHFLDYK